MESLEDMEDGEDVEDGEVSSGGFLGHSEVANRNALAAACGEGRSWVEAVLTGGGGGAVNPIDGNETGNKNESDDEDAEKHADASRYEQEPPPPGTASADSKPPPSAVALARREAALVHRVMALLSNDNTKKNADSAASAAESAAENDDKRRELLTLLAEAAADGVDVPRWLGHGRSSNRGRTPLMEAAMQGRTGCTAALAEAACCACGGGARGSGERGLNARNERGWYSALHYACYHGHAGATLELLVRGADPRLRNRENETALQSALANGQMECADLVRDFLRRPMFEPDEGTPLIVQAAVVDRCLPPSSSLRTPTTTEARTDAARGEDDRASTGGPVGVSVGMAIGGVAGTAPEVSRENTVYCLGRRRRRLGARVRPGRGLGVGVGTAAAEVSLGARKRARLHATNPCAGTPMEAFVLWSIASGHDPFHGEGGGGEEDESDDGRGGRGAGANEVWLEYYVQVYNASVRRWRNHHRRSTGRPSATTTTMTSAAPTAGKDPAVQRAAEKKQNVVAVAAAPAPEPEPTPSTYFLVVKKSKALAEGRRFELPCGTDVVIGRSQHLAGIVVRDEMVSKTHLRVEVSQRYGFRVLDLGSKHGAVITKPAPPTRAPPPSTKNKPVPATAAAGGSAPAAPPAPKKFFPIPIPRKPEWVAGAHGDSITLGQTTFTLEREGGPEPPRPRYRPPAAAAAARKGEDEQGVARSSNVRPAAPAPTPAVISKGFTANPNLLDAIRSAEEMERARKRRAAASEAAAAAAAAYLSNKRARSSSTSAAVGPAGETQQRPTAPGTTAPAPAVIERGDPSAAGTVTSGGENSFEHVSKGSMLLRRMGWSDGQGLGRRSDGQLQPVQVVRRGEREGLGTVQSDSSNPFAMGADGRISKWEQMRRRFTIAQQSTGTSYRDRQRHLQGAGRTGGWLRGGVEGGDGRGQGEGGGQ